MEYFDLRDFFAAASVGNLLPPQDFGVRLPTSIGLKKIRVGGRW